MGEYIFEKSPLYEYFQYGGRWNYGDYDFVKEQKKYTKMDVEVIGELGTITCTIYPFDMHVLAYLAKDLGKIKTVNILNLI
ncbi:MAG: hypothetical protein MJZ37_08190 [Bacilli bacterium]|nr:hypothetical protein [Bacilli bacterium]